MKESPHKLAVQESAWRLLKGLRPKAIDLTRIELIQGLSSTQLTNTEALSALLPQLGLNDEGMAEFPPHLHSFCGQGLRIWQYPIQFAPYLAMLARLQIRSYLELGIRHGGSYIATVELLNRSRRLDFAVGVDIIPCLAMADYQRINTRSHFACVNSQSPEFAELLAQLGEIDLVFIDSHHEAGQCRREFATLGRHANMIAFHDISNIGCPGIAEVWAEIKSAPGWACYEFTAQYPDLGPFMGIGLAIKHERLNVNGE